MMENRKIQLASLAVVVLLAAFLRIYDLGDRPAGFYCDEAGLGYNAYTIANYGTDENGRSFPLFFWSFGVSYKNPAFVYAAAIPVKLFGTTEFAVRLTSALFGIGTVIGIFFLGRALMGAWLGLFAALFLAICPWHLHFSRIAFELIAFPFFFTLGLSFFVRFTQGRQTLPLAMFFFGLCFYAYAIANLFVPLFVIGATLLFLPTFFRRFGQSAIALVTLAATVAPVAAFYVERMGTSGSQYFRNTTHLKEGEALSLQLERTWGYYLEFFSPAFLFERGDPIVRHAVPGFGELYPFFLPLLLVGAAVCLLYPNRRSKLPLLWLALYPLGASLMTEIPSASRGFIGAPAFCLVTAVGAVAILRALGWIGRWRPVSLTLQAAAIGAGLFVLVPQVQAYLHAYFVDYPAQSAPGYGGFQYGYRDVVQYMESKRSEYDLLMLTAVEVNQPQVFPQFYRGVKPNAPSGYMILNPAEFGRYSPDQRILASLRPSDLDLFSDYEIHKEIIAPGGRKEFVIAEIKARKQFLTNWLVLGLFENDNLTGIDRDSIDITDLRRDRYQGAFDEVFWRRITPQFVLVDLNQFFTRADPRNIGNPEHVCAYAALTVHADASKSAFLEISGTDDVAKLWLNGRSLTPFPLMLGGGHKSRPIDLHAGDNLLVLKTCENVGGWAFKARITNADGGDLAGITTSPEIPDSLPPVVADGADAAQLVEGFASIVAFGQRHENHGDYRGGTESWWASVHDQQSEVVWHTAPAPAAARTVFAFTASVANETGKAELFVGGKYAVTFDLGPYTDVRTWRRGPYALTFVPKQPAAGNSGFFLLQVPTEDVRAGEAVELRVLPAGGQAEAWFGLKSYRDTIAHEKLTLEQALEAQRATWSDGDRKPAEPQPDQPSRRLLPQRPTPQPDATKEPTAGTETSASGNRAEAKADVDVDADADTDAAARARAWTEAQAQAPREPQRRVEPGLALPLNDLDALDELGALVDGVEPSNDGGAYFADDAVLAIPDAGAAVGAEGALSFWVEPAWDGSSTSDHSFVQLRDPQSWENRIQIFKNGSYLRFLFTDASGTESGVGTDITHWAAGARHHITATWAEGMTYLYVDGLLVGTNPYPAELRLAPTTPLFLGSDHPGGIPGADAIIGGFEAVDRELTADDVGARLAR